MSYACTDFLEFMSNLLTDDEPILNDGLKMPTVIESVKEQLQSKLQNLTKTLTPADNGKFLKCRATHPAYPNGYAETKSQLNVKCEYSMFHLISEIILVFVSVPPQEVYGTIDRFGYQLGSLGLINLTIEANPKPKIEWTVAGQKIREGQADNSGRIVAEEIREMVRQTDSLRLCFISRSLFLSNSIKTNFHSM